MVVYGAAAAHSAAVVRAFSGQRALVFLADSSQDRAETEARRVNDAGGVAQSALVDLLDQNELEEYTAELAEWTGGIDVAVVAVADEEADAQLAIAGMVAERMAAQGSGIVVIMSADRTSERDFWRLTERAAVDGVAVLPVFSAPALPEAPLCVEGSRS
ncbi:hypothetical protein [Streptomyces sp. NPDC046985]|uniref:hypothetical protein n=1 Tax=Streptomyces sp. NPDC046985 TaxID=3155377 RepID=UPI0033ED5DAD